MLQIPHWDIDTRGPLLCFYSPTLKSRTVVHMGRLREYWSDLNKDLKQAKITFKVELKDNPQETTLLWLYLQPEYVPLVLDYVDRNVSKYQIVERTPA